MTTLTASHARSHLYQLMDEVNLSHHPVLITGKRTNAVLISESDWSAIQETLHLLSVPGMHQSIIEGINTPLKKCSKDLDW